MTAADPALAELLTTLLERDVQIRADGGRLHYDAPAEAASGDLVESLRQGKAALLGWLARAPDGREVVQRVLPPYNQQELWSRAATAPLPAVYTISLRLRLRGEFDPAAMTTALSRLTQRHPPLRSRFRTYHFGAGDQPVLEVLATVPVRLPVTDLRYLPEADRDTELEDRCQQHLQVPLPLEAAPLWRGQIFRLAQAEHVLLWTVHHVIVDGWSFRSLVDELFAEYQRVRDGQAPVVAEHGPTHCDFARHQRRLLAGPQRARLEAYWREALAGADLRLALPYDHPAPPVPTRRGAVAEFRLEPATLDRLRRAARTLDATLYLLLLSAYGLAISRWTGQPDLVIPTSYAGRGEPGYESVVGLLADRLPIRVRPGAAETFAALVTQVGQSVFAALDQPLPLGLLTQCLPGDQRPPAPYPAVLFTLIEPDGSGHRRLPGLRADPEPAEPAGLARMDVYCFLTTGPTGLHGVFEYAVDRFAPTTLDRFAAGFMALLEEVAADPRRPLDRDLPAA